jgi:hypothetical protein
LKEYLEDFTKPELKELGGICLIEKYKTKLDKTGLN